MTAETFERIRDDYMIQVRTDGALSYDGRLEKMLDADVLEMLLTIVGDNIRTDPDLQDWGERVDWGGVTDDCREEGLL